MEKILEAITKLESLGYRLVAIQLFSDESGNFTDVSNDHIELGGKYLSFAATSAEDTLEDILDYILNYEA